MTLNLTPRRDAMLQEMGIVLFARSPNPRAQAPLARVSSAPLRMSPKASTPSPEPKISRPLGASLASAPISEASSAVSKPLVSSPAKPLPDLQTLSWSDLNACVASCDQCHLGPQAPARHFGSKPLGASSSPIDDQPQEVSWLVVSDAPKLGLDNQAHVFNAASQPLFGQFFKALESTSPPSKPWGETVYLTSALKCVPLKHEDALGEESLVCLSFLREQIRRLKPKVLVVMGRVAAQILLAGTPEHLQPLGRLRGKILSFEGTPMVVTYSPEFLLHAQPDKALCWEDLCLAQSIEAQSA